MNFTIKRRIYIRHVINIIDRHVPIFQIILKAYVNDIFSRTWARNLRPSNTSGQHLMKCFVEKERLDCRIQRASSVNGWNCASGLSMSSSSPSRIPRHAIPQIFAYEPKPGVFRSLNYQAFHSIRIEQVSIFQVFISHFSCLY